MKKPPLIAAQEAQVAALSMEFARHLARVGVDMQAASPRLRDIAPPIERRLSENEVEVSLTIDASGIVETLRGLPDGAGTDAFVAAYNSRTPGAAPGTG